VTLRGRIAVVGAGFAGSVAAWRLAEAGLEPVLFDRLPEPGSEAACGGVMLRSLGEHLGMGEVASQPVDTVHILGGRRPRTLRFRRPVFVSFDRGALDRDLALRAVAGGADLRPGCRVTDWHPTTGELGWTEDGRMHRERFRAIVFADGPRTLAAAGGLGVDPGSPEGGAMYRELRIPEGDRSWISFSFTMAADDPGYYWVFPKGGRLQVGVGRLHGRRRTPLRTLLDRFIAGDPRLATLPVAGSRGGIIPFRPARTFGSVNAMVVGDAAGLVNPLTGGGLVYAAASGEMAAAALVWAERRGEDGAAAALRYADRLERSVHMAWLRVLQVPFTSQHRRVASGRPTLYRPLCLLYAMILPRLTPLADAITLRGPRGGNP